MKHLIRTRLNQGSEPERPYYSSRRQVNEVVIIPTIIDRRGSSFFVPLFLEGESNQTLPFLVDKNPADYVLVNTWRISSDSAFHEKEGCSTAH